MRAQERYSLQAAVYVGAPAALESFRMAERVLKEIGRDA
jgi:alkylhydroperoxidase/carboxymuconolactone decarboxylase family protein YurZ